MTIISNFLSWCKQMYHKLVNWWNEIISDEELEKLSEEYNGNIPAHLFYKNPIKKWWEKTKVLIDNSVGKGGFLTLVGCALVLGFILLTGGSSILAVTGIGVATVYGAILAINRFPKLEKFVTKYYKVIDLALFALGFYAANSIFGFQVAAVGGVLVSAALILWKVYTDSKVREGVKEELNKIKEDASHLVNSLTSLAPADAAAA